MKKLFYFYETTGKKTGNKNNQLRLVQSTTFNLSKKKNINIKHKQNYVIVYKKLKVNL